MGSNQRVRVGVVGGTNLGSRDLGPEVAIRETVVLVDEHDVEIGTAEKIAAHQGAGQLHRAFSLFLFDDLGRMLIQRRAASKYHFPLLWTNACCGHPRPGEDVLAAAHRRLSEELGIRADIEFAFRLAYEARDPQSGLIERELDHVFIGRVRGTPAPDPGEIDSIEWHLPGDLSEDSLIRPDRYTPWFRRVLEEVDRRGAFAAFSRAVVAPDSSAERRPCSS